MKGQAIAHLSPMCHSSSKSNVQVGPLTSDHVSLGQAGLNEEQAYVKKVRLIRGDGYTEQRILNVRDCICMTLKGIK